LINKSNKTKNYNHKYKKYKNINNKISNYRQKMKNSKIKLLVYMENNINLKMKFFK